MNKMKVMVMAVLMVMASLNAEEVKAYDQCSGTVKVYTSEMKVNKVKESKLTNLSYLKKTYKAKYKYVLNNAVGYFSSDGKAGFIKVVYAHGTEKKGTVIKMGVVNVDDEVYGRVVVREPGMYTLTCNLHDTEYSFKGRLAAYFTEEEVEDIVKEMKDVAIELALDLKEKTN